jgi:hypothetical protein
MSTPDSSPRFEVVGGADHDTLGVDLVDHAAAARGDGSAGVARHDLASMPVPTSGASAFTSGTA